MLWGHHSTLPDMAPSRLVVTTLAIAGGLVAAQRLCNPTKSSCPLLRGLTQGFKSDFNAATSIPSDWTVADGASSLLSLRQDDLEFRLNKGTDAPYIWTKDYIHYGKFTVILQSSPGIGVISSAVLMSDPPDEMDWEWSGNDFNYKVSTVQTNYFGQGIEEIGTAAHSRQ